jgi:hypothetical protein
MYTNVPAYEPAPGLRIRIGLKFAIAQRVPGFGAVVTAAYRTRHEADKARRRAMYHNEWVSDVLMRSAAGWVPANPRRRAMYALPTQAPELAAS